MSKFFFLKIFLKKFVELIRKFSLLPSLSLFQAIDHEVALPVLEDKRNVLVLASEIFGRRSALTNTSLQIIVEQGSKILAGLFRAEEARRDDRAARTLMAAAGPPTGGSEDEDKLETFAEILQRISRSLNTNPAQHRGTPPPTRNIPNGMMGRTLGRAPSFFNNPPANIDLNNNAAFDVNPWPFPSPLPIDESADLSINFFRDMGLLGNGNGNSNELEISGGDNFWTSNLPGVEQANGMDNLDDFRGVEQESNAGDWDAQRDPLGQGW